MRRSTLSTLACLAATTMLAFLAGCGGGGGGGGSPTVQPLEQDPNEPRAALAPIQAVICRHEYTRNARQLLGELRAEFDVGDRVTILDTVIPSAVAYKDAFTARRPVHQLNRQGGTRCPSGYEVMHRIVWELQPQLYGHFAGRLRGDPREVFGPSQTAHAAARAA